MDLDPAQYGAIPPGLSIDRDPVTGRVREIIAGYGNAGNVQTNGVDLRANTNFDLGEMGRLRNRLSVSWINEYSVTDVTGSTSDFAGNVGTPDTRATLQNEWAKGDLTVTFGTNYIAGQENNAGTVKVGGYATNDLQVAWKAPWNATIAVGATNIGDRYPQLVGYSGRPWNFYLYDAYGRTTYFRYTQQF